MPGSFDGKVVIVTGSSQGIGRETARMFAEQGAKLTITGRNGQALEETKQLLIASGATAEEIVTIVGDIQDEALQMKIIEETINRFWRIDVLINNAGALAPNEAKVQGFDMTMQDFDYTMNLNLRSVVSLSKLALPYLERTQGSIVNVSSIASHIANTAFPFYAASKAALDSITQSMALAYIEKGIRVNAVNPGWTSTTLMQKLGMTAEQQAQFEAKNCVDRHQIPIGRAGQPAEIGELILFLADSKKSEYIVGQCIIIDGGRSLVRPHIDPTK